MEYKEFAENADISISVDVYVNGERAFGTTAFSTDYLLDFIRPIDSEISRTLAEQWELLPERTIENE